MPVELVSNTARKRIKFIHFGVLSPQEIAQSAEIEIYQRDLYDPQSKQTVVGGVLDRKMGISSKDGQCDTCAKKLADCTGHFGYIPLALPVFHAGYFKATVQILQQICKSCSRVMLDERDRRMYLKRLRVPTLENPQKMKILKQISTACKKCTSCPYCQETNGTVKKVGVLKIIHEKYRAKSKSEELAAFRSQFSKAMESVPEIKQHLSKAQDDLNPIRVLELFKKICADDCELLGLDPTSGRPEYFIWTCIPAPPVCIRPSVVMDRGEAGSNEDDLTVKLAECITINHFIRKSLEDGDTTMKLAEDWEFLQIVCAQYVNSEMPGLSAAASSTGKWVRGLCQRLKGKQGRFRGNLSGKRVDFSGRTVISPDPNLRIDQVAIPEHVAKILTYPDVVNSTNLEMLKQRVINGPDVHPGANYVEPKNGMKRFLKFVSDRSKLANELRIGDIVERHIHDGDVVLFNRQPSLHRLSIMSHFAKIRPWRTFRFNECVCTPYNADFDGDEMNIHVPQTQEARAEAVELMGVKNNLVTPRNGQPLIAATQDFITGSFLISRKDTFFNRAQFCQVAATMFDAEMHIDVPPPAILKPQALWTGKQIFNILLKPNKNSPVNVNLETKNRSFQRDPVRANDLCPNDGWLVVQNSEIMCGGVDKSIVGDGNKESLFYVVLRDFGPIHAANCMNRLAKLCARWLANQGFSIGLEDVTPGDRLSRLRDQVIAEGYKECDKLIEEHRKGTLQCQPGCNIDQTLEAQISGKLSRIRDDLGQVCLNELDRLNAPLIMSVCGSKGSKINVCQMVACVGQQIIGGSRVADGFDDRTLPHFPKHDRTPAAKGFVRNSFYTGLEPHEFIFHAASGREGLVDTAVKSVTGDTPIVVLEDGKPIYTTIGDWIDCHLAISSEKIKHFEERNMEYLETSVPTFIPTMDEDGVVTWGQVSAMTRHDPGTELYQIKTRAGKSVIVTESKSLLTWNKTIGKFQEIPTPEIKVGDFVPVTSQLPVSPVVIEDVDMESGSTSKFHLNPDNGMFLGLYMAAGDFRTENVKISHNDLNIQEFIEDWFKSQDVDFERISDEQKDGTDVSFVGYSSRLAKFLKDFVVGDDGEVHVPSDAFVAHTDFIVGLLNGYFSACGFLSENSIVANCLSQRLADGISMLCSRLGVFAQVLCHETSYKILIEGYWLKKFIEWVNLLVSSNLVANKCESEFCEHNNVVLDEIVEINILGVDKYPKVYDLTIPSTLNFGLANGLQVRDTAETGYMQRRLMKALEDLAIQYDYSVRNSSGHVIQFAYGNDKLDPIFMEGDDKPIVFSRTFTASQLQNMPTSTDKALFPHEIIDHVEKSLKKVDGYSDEFVSQLREFIDKQVAQKLLKLRSHHGLAAKSTNKNVKSSQRVVDQQMVVTRRQLDAFLKTCHQKYFRAKIEPGTAVGALGAQSIGEPGTQMTLKTFHFAGVASMNVTLGVPRIKEIINASKVINTPIITGCLAIENNETVARIVKGRIETTTIGDVIDYIEEVIKSHECHLELKIDLDTIRALQLETNMGKICDAISKHKKLKIGRDQIQQVSNDCIRILVREKDQAQVYYTMQKYKRGIAAVSIIGIPAVDRAVINEQEGKAGLYELLVEGYGLQEVMNTDGIVGTRTSSNHVMEVEKVLGIEAARQTIITQIQYTMGKHGMTIDSRHVMLLADIMTFKGEVLGITRFGIAKMKDSVLMLASFEKTTDHLFDAALYGKKDAIDGVSECIIMGIPMPIGTGMFKLVQDTESIKLVPRKSRRKPKKDQHAIEEAENEFYEQKRELLFDLPQYHPKIQF